ncbi:hypothetical protein [Alteromonas sp. 14N.309.X.WAT.G.H12]|uniref:hypothetical protein n=1 Tax=Alteromonas sp. 14N.309.X.WAT.G.H12 TaxID=3120824 RepID=UPI002FD4B02F
MLFTRKSLFEKTRKLWPDKINLNGQYFGRSLVTGGQVLNEIYHQIESSLNENDHWMQLSCWSFHQAIEKPDNLTTIINIDDIAYESYEKMMLENLNGDDCWEEERKIYESLKSS